MIAGEHINLTVDEIVAHLKRSSIPTVIVEGSDDIVVYRFIERTFGAVNVSVLPVGGRDNVLAIFQRRAEFGAPVFFIADRDTWCITGVPDAFTSDQIALTRGYSIENDAINDGQFIGYLTEVEAARLRDELETFIDWYALALDRHFKEAGGSLSTHPNAILDDHDNRARLVQLLDGESYPQALKDQLAAAPFELVRGKSVFAVLMRQLSYAGRVPRHHHLALMEMVGANPGQRIGEIFNRVSAFFNLTPTTQHQMAN